MKEIIEIRGGVPVKSWIDKTDLDSATLTQIENLARLPFAFSHVAIMPDAHVGYGMPIGGVLATKGKVIPNAVGMDIGCGMRCVKLDVENIPTETLKSIMGVIRKLIPVGKNHHRDAVNSNFMPDTSNDNLEDYPIVNREYFAALKQLGTLGGGNHFIEFQQDDEGSYYVMIHSGSRNIGKQVAEHYIKLAVELNKKWCSAVPTFAELAFLPVDSSEGVRYLKEMEFCVKFAEHNRSLMLTRIIGVLDTFGIGVTKNPIDIPHNYVQVERHFGHMVWVHRKGATYAGEDTLGIIPGSQGTSSYIVRGLGNRFSFNSCSHGAGRVLGRKAATRELDLQNEITRLDARGIIHSIRTVSDLEEAPGAYKDIDAVMKAQSDLVKIIRRLTPIAVIKG